MKTRPTRTPRRPQWPPQPAAAPEGQTRTPVDADGSDLQLPHERDQSTKTDADAAKPREVMRQAKADLDAGQVDTDMRATPGLDAQRREELLRKQRR